MRWRPGKEAALGPNMDVLLQLRDDRYMMKSTKPWGLFGTYGNFQTWAHRTFRLAGAVHEYGVHADGRLQDQSDAFCFPKTVELSDGCRTYTFFFGYDLILEKTCGADAKLRAVLEGNTSCVPQCALVNPPSAGCLCHIM